MSYCKYKFDNTGIITLKPRDWVQVQIEAFLSLYFKKKMGQIKIKVLNKEGRFQG